MKKITYALLLVAFTVKAQTIDLGFVTPESEGSIQKCFDSEFTCKLTKLQYKIDTTLIANRAKIINGNNSTLIPTGNFDVISV